MQEHKCKICGKAESELGTSIGHTMRIYALTDDDQIIPLPENWAGRCVQICQNCNIKRGAEKVRGRFAC